MKQKTRFACTSCGYEAPRWVGQCPACQSWNTLEEKAAESGPGRRRPSATARGARIVALGDIEGEDILRYRTGIGELDRVLGGGLVPGSLVLVAGDPGVGKSTLLLQAASAYASLGLRVLYVAAEESERQLRLRSRRLGDIHDAIGVVAGTRLEAVAPAVEGEGVDLVIVDSIQTLYHEEGGPPGSVGQVRDNTLYFLELAKRSQVPVILVGHVTKEGTVAGPRVMEHMVDAVLYLEGDRFHDIRILRATKNRFGPTHEIGMFEMRESGLGEVANPSEIFLEERREGTPGSSVVVAMEGTRPLLLEVQALVGSAGAGTPRRVAMGLDGKRLAVLLAVLERRAGLDLSAHDVFASVAGGFRVAEPGVDLALALAVASSYRDLALDARTVVMGEVGLGGEVRRTPKLTLRLREAAKLGFTRAVVPESGVSPGDRDILELVAVGRVDEALEKTLGPEPGPGARLSGTSRRPLAART